MRLRAIKDSFTFFARRLSRRLFVMTQVRINKVKSLTGHRDCVYTVCPSNDPQIFFSAAGDGMVVKWDLITPDEGEVVARLSNSVFALRHLPNSDTLVVGHNREGIHALDWRTKRELYSIQLTKGSIFDIQSGEADLFVATGEGEVVVVHEPSRTVKARLNVSQESIRTIDINERVGEFAVGGSDYHIRTFDLDTFKLKKEWKAHSNSVFTLRYSPDGRLLLSGSRDAHLKIWDVDGDYAPVDDIAAHLYAINHITFSPDSKHFVTCSMDKSLKIWDASNGRLLKVVDKARHAGHGTSVNKLLWTSFNNNLISASDDRTISVWDVFFDL
jgi:WD40 repeat protein